MKQFFAWMKLVGLVLAALGASLSVYMWALLAGYPSPIDLIGPTLWSYPVLDWLVTMTLVGFGILTFVYAIAEQRTWKNLLFGLPMFVLNAVTLYTWWHMELGKGTDVNVATILFSFVVLTNACAAAIYLFRRFQLPTIETT
jgi:hypothetical protein